MFTKKRKLGKTIDQLSIGDTYERVKKIEDKDILLYLGFTDDANPVYIQHDYTCLTPYEKPIVPHIMLHGIVSTTISMNLPGPGSTIAKLSLSYPNPLYHYGTLNLLLTITEIDEKNHHIVVNILGKDEDGTVIMEGEVVVCPPYPWKPITHNSGNFDNF